MLRKAQLLSKSGEHHHSNHGESTWLLGINEEWGLTVLWLLEKGNPKWLSLTKCTPRMAIDLFEWWLMAVWYYMSLLLLPLSIIVRIVNYKLQSAIFTVDISIDLWHKWKQYQIVKWQFGQQMHEVLNVYIGIETKFGDNI